MDIYPLYTYILEEGPPGKIVLRFGSHLADRFLTCSVSTNSTWFRQVECPHSCVASCKYAYKYMDRFALQVWFRFITIWASLGPVHMTLVIILEFGWPHWEDMGAHFGVLGLTFGDIGGNPWVGVTTKQTWPILFTAIATQTDPFGNPGFACFVLCPKLVHVISFWIFCDGFWGFWGLPPSMEMEVRPDKTFIFTFPPWLPKWVDIAQNCYPFGTLWVQNDKIEVQ